ncbi:MAG: TolC family protein [Acidobacteriota bacterium]|nr:TolC family protein [Acidobacteriota bacterium]
MIRKVLALTLSLLVFPVAAQPVNAPDSPAGVPLSLADATARALARNHEIAFERDAFRITDAVVLRSEGSYDPSFRLDARYRSHTDPVNSLLSGAPAGEISPSAEGFSTSASIGQLLPTGATVNVSASGSRDLTNSFFTVLSPAWSTSIGIDVRQPLLQGLSLDPARRALRIARIDRERGSASLRRVVTEAVASVERAYWSLVAARRDVLVREASVRLAGDQRDDTKTKIEVGTLAESEIAQPIAELERRKGDLYASQESARRAELLLKLLLLDDENDPLWNQRLLPADRPETDLRRVDLAAALKEADARRPEIAEASARVAERDVDVAFAKSRILPQVDLVASYGRRGLAGDLNPNAPSIGFTGQPVAVPDALNGGLGRSLGTIGEGRFPDASIGVSVGVPILNRVARGDTAIAKAQKSQAVTSLSQQRQRVAVDVRNAALTLETAAARIEAAKAGREAAETQLRAEQERYGVGLSTNFFVLTRQNDLAQASLTETAALTDYRKALTDFARSTGVLLDERRIEIKDDAPAFRADGGR